MGDGNLHPTFLTDERNEAEMNRVELAMKEVFRVRCKTWRKLSTVGAWSGDWPRSRFYPAALGPVGMELLQRVKT